MQSIKIWMRIIIISLVIIGSLNWGIIAVNPEYNILNVIPDRYSYIRSYVMGIIGLSAIYISLDITSFLPFLGECAVPVFKFLNDTTMNNLTPSAIAKGYKRIEIEIPSNEEGTKIIYWAANPSDSITNSPVTAYSDFDNSGIANIVNKVAVISLLCPANYKVGFRTLNKHIHFRVVNSNGILSKIYTYKNQISDICNV
jgi:uncharacterized membrane protein YuzA (DUF378 family)